MDDSVRRICRSREAVGARLLGACLMWATIVFSAGPALSPVGRKCSPGKREQPVVIRVLGQNLSGTTLEVEVPGVELSETLAGGRRCSRLSVPGGTTAPVDAGRPSVPAIVAVVAVPNGAKVTVESMSLDTETLHVSNVLPYQPPRSAETGASLFVFDLDFYRRGIMGTLPVFLDEVRAAV